MSDEQSLQLSWRTRRLVRDRLATVIGISVPKIIAIAQGQDLDVQAPDAEAADRWLVATGWGLAEVVANDVAWQRPWTDAVSARSVPQQSVIEVSWIDGTQSALRLSEASRRHRRTLGLIIKEQIENSIVVSERVRISPRDGAAKQTVLVAVRRAEDRSLFSQVLGSAMLDLDDERISSQIADIESRLRTMCGLPG